MKLVELIGLDYWRWRVYQVNNLIRVNVVPGKTGKLFTDLKFMALFFLQNRKKQKAMETYDLASASIKELEAEYTASKKCLERIPESLYEYKPHPRSMGMGYLALLVAEIPLWITFMIEKGEVDFATYARYEWKTTQDLVDHFEECFQGAVKALKGVTAEDLERPFYLKNDGQVIFEIPQKDNLTMTINHWVHHRGQLTVYMRLNDIPVPSVYGPSADEKVF